ncbi:hypothetical protein WN944_006887 [Citrus x changshan-huyou]|uniref:DUF1995 domain-containing protein n=1 Tax=Citrus x changshan-huyou TaxID=2935761 RepID=A0AAP0MLV9_9ROSI
MPLSSDTTPILQLDKPNSASSINSEEKAQANSSEAIQNRPQDNIKPSRCGNLAVWCVHQRHNILQYGHRPPYASYSGSFNSTSAGKRIVTFLPYRRKRHCLTNSVSSDGNNPINVDIPFPSDYSELLDQAKMAAELAMKDGRKLMEIEFPTAGLDSVPGDGEGGIEMTGSMRFICEFCDLFVTPEKVTRTRIIWSSVEKDAEVMRLPTEDLPFGKKKLFLLVNPTVRKKLFVPGLEIPTADIKFFPEANKVKFARKSVFEASSFKLDYLTKPSFFEDFGFTEKVKMADRVKPEDELFLVAYPYFNVNGSLTPCPPIELLVYNFLVLQLEVVPSLKEVALDILPSA